jgi:Protein of unknown function (DUF2630)
MSVERGEESLFDPREPDIPKGVEAYAHVEGLMGEETELLEVPHEQRSEQQHERLREIREQLDHVWEKLRDRAERRGGQQGGTGAGDP